MADSDNEAPKQLPLNEEEVAILEDYLDQWNSTLGQERVVVWGDVTREARLKAPEMNAKMLKARKNVSSPPPPFTLGHALMSHPPRSTGNGCRITGVRKTPNLPSNLAGSGPTGLSSSLRGRKSS